MGQVVINPHLLALAKAKAARVHQPHFYGNSPRARPTPRQGTLGQQYGPGVMDKNNNVDPKKLHAAEKGLHGTSLGGHLGQTHVRTLPTPTGPKAVPHHTQTNIHHAVHTAIHNNKPSSRPVGGGGGHPSGGGGHTVAPKPSAGFTGPGSPNVGLPVDPSLASSGAKPYNLGYADTLAGLEYNPQIATAKQGQARQERDAAQSLADIQHWYGQVHNSLGTAQTRNQAASSQAVNDIGGMTSSILSSLGGNANMGAGLIAGAGANAGATQAAMGSAEQQYQNDLAPLLQAEQAGQMVGQGRRNTANAQDLANQLMQLQGQKGASAGQLKLQLMGQNNTISQNNLDNMLKIREYNNALAQQGFQNRLSTSEAQVAANMTGAQIKALGGQGSSGGFKPWLSLQPGDKQALINAGMANVVDPTKGGAINTSPLKAWQLMKQYLRGQGYTSVGSGNMAGHQMQAMIDAAIQHAIAINQSNAAAAKGINQ